MKEKMKFKIGLISIILLLITCVGLGVGIGVCYTNFPNSQKTFIESNRAEVERIFTDANWLIKRFLMKINCKQTILCNCVFLFDR